MRKVILILFTVVIASANMLAQETQQTKPKRTPEERAEMMTQKMTKELSLNADQQTKVKALMLKRMQDRDAKIKEGKDDKEKAEGEMKSILTPEQYQIYQQKREEMKQKHMEKHAAPTSPASNTPQPK